MLPRNDESIITETLPEGLINLGDNNHIANMANFSMYFNAKNAVSNMDTESMSTQQSLLRYREANKTSTPLSQDELQKFGNWTGQTDTKVMAADLKKRGLIGAQQLIDDNPDLTSASSIRNAQSDWKVNVIQQIVSNAKKHNLKTREEVMANKDLLITKPEWKEAVNTDSFKNIHPNFWSIITDSILPEQYKKFDSEKSLVKK